MGLPLALAFDMQGKTLRDDLSTPKVDHYRNVIDLPRTYPATRRPKAQR
jgi:hypothetical protein